MNLGEWIRPFSIPNIRGVFLTVEPLSEVRTPLADFLSILLGGLTVLSFACDYYRKP
jgi:hypothetical protein